MTYLKSFVDELEKIAISGVEAAGEAEKRMGNAAIAQHRPMTLASSRSEYLGARALHPRGPARRAFLGHQMNNMSGFAQQAAKRSSRFLTLARLATA